MCDWRLSSLLAAAALGAACGGPETYNPELAPAGGFFLTPHGEPLRFTPEASALEAWFLAADADHDGRLAPSEFDADGVRFFTAVDANGDAEATAAEVSAYRTSAAPMLENMAAYMPAPGAPRARALAPQQMGGMRPDGPRERAPALLSLLDEREPVLASDSDFNRRVTRAEFAAASADRFRLLDTDGDGALTLARLRPSLR